MPTIGDSSTPTAATPVASAIPFLSTSVVGRVDTRRGAGGIPVANIPANVAGQLDWYGWTWPKDVQRPIYFTLIETETSFAEMIPGEPHTVDPAPGKGTDLHSVVATAPVAGWRGIAFRHDAKLPYLFRLQDDCLIWTKRDATFEQRLEMLVAMGMRSDDDRRLALAAVAETEEERQQVLDRPTEAKRFNLTDVGNAERLMHYFGNQLKYCHDWKRWLIWDGQRWEFDRIDGITEFTRKTARKILIESEAVNDKEERKQVISWSFKSETRDRQMSMAALAQHDAAVLAEQLDAHPMLLNFQNGTLDLHTGELREHHRSDLLTTVVNIEYSENAKAPTWERFLRDVFAGNHELIRFVQRAVGYTLTGDVREQVLPICYGTGSNGKTVFLNILKNLLGPLAIHAAQTLLMAGKNERHPTEMADLFGKRLAVCQETEQGARFNESLVKSLTGSDPIRARRMREDFWEFLPTHKVWLSTNHKPVIRGTDHAIWRRILLIPFTVPFSDTSLPRKDPKMESKLLAELSGILSWAVRGCLAWQQDGLQPPAVVDAATAEYRAQMDALAGFLEECCILQANAKTQASLLYQTYLTWCTQNGERPENQRSFGLRLSERGFERFKVRGLAWWRGLGVVDHVDDVDLKSGCTGSENGPSPDKPESSST